MLSKYIFICNHILKAPNKLNLMDMAATEAEGKYCKDIICNHIRKAPNTLNLMYMATTEAEKFCKDMTNVLKPIQVIKTKMGDEINKNQVGRCHYFEQKRQRRRYGEAA